MQSHCHQGGAPPIQRIAEQLSADLVRVERRLLQAEAELRAALAAKAGVEVEVERLRRQTATDLLSFEQQGVSLVHGQSPASQWPPGKAAGALHAAQETIAGLNCQLAEQRAAAAEATGKAEALRQQVEALLRQQRAEAAVAAALRRRMAAAGAATAVLAQQQQARGVALQRQLTAQLARTAALEQALAGRQQRAAALGDVLLELTRGRMPDSQAEAAAEAGIASGCYPGKRAESPGADAGAAVAAGASPHKAPACSEQHAKMPAGVRAAQEWEQGMREDLNAAQAAQAEAPGSLAAAQKREQSLRAELERQEHVLCACKRHPSGQPDRAAWDADPLHNVAGDEREQHGKAADYLPWETSNVEPATEFAAGQHRQEEPPASISAPQRAARHTCDSARERVQPKEGPRPVLASQDEEEPAACKRAAAEAQPERAAAAAGGHAEQRGVHTAGAQLAVAALKGQAAWAVGMADAERLHCLAASAAQPDSGGQREALDSQERRQERASPVRQQPSGVQGHTPGAARDQDDNWEALAFQGGIDVQAAAATFLSAPAPSDNDSISCNRGEQASQLRRQVRELEGWVQALLRRLAQLEAAR